ncbi:hypothetical protein [Nonomuraea dietziae]|uniref:hypothetical protein n=1 Tax=Nonomuraea dietziae TaxID=65515 RepID=UPI0033E5D020
MRAGVAAALAAVVAAVPVAGSSAAGTASAAPSTVDCKPSPDKPEVDCGGTVTVPVD